jgi:hypothetical protein
MLGGMDTATAWILLAVLVAIAIAAPRYGVDSRWLPPGEPPPPPERRPTPRGDLVALARRAVQAFQSHWPRVNSSTLRPSSSRRSAT